MSAVSSQVPTTLLVTEILLKPDSLNGLRTESVIKVDRIFTLKAKKFLANIGKLSTLQIDMFKIIFKSLVD